MATLYDIKPAFQARLRPLTKRLAKAGVTANQVTLAAAVLSIAAGAAIAAMPTTPWVFWLLPLVLFLRMALNAIDGMLAREHDQASTLGMFLNEICDVVSDLALILPFTLVSPFAAWGVIAFALAAFMTEFAGVLGIPAGAGRRYDGPLGKSDRAAVLGIVAAIIGLGFVLPAAASWIFPLLAVLSVITVFNRVRAALRAAQ
jgi:CDP-diacylglycerol--glycerol-3-phosphate 3-phosphatidyltransferase